MGNLPPSLPVTPAYDMVARSKSLLDFNTKAGPPEPSTSQEIVTRRRPRSGDKLLCDPNKFAQAFSQFYCEFAALAHVPRD